MKPDSLIRLTLTALIAAMLCACTDADRHKAQGFFSYNDVRLDIQHAVAVRRAPRHLGEPGEVLIYLSQLPVDATQLAVAFNPDATAEQFARDHDTGFVRICISPSGQECWLKFYNHEPMANFTSGGQGSFSL